MSSTAVGIHTNAHNIVAMATTQRVLHTHTYHLLCLCIFKYNIMCVMYRVCKRELRRLRAGNRLTTLRSSSQRCCNNNYYRMKNI